MKRLLLAGFATGLLLAPHAVLAQGIGLGTRGPVVTINDLDGNGVDLGQWVGKKPVLLEFWATWCDNCELLLPTLKAAHQTWGDRVEFIGVNVVVNQTPEKVRRYMESHGIPFRVLYDTRGASVRAYQAPATSYVVILDRTGKVIYTGIGAVQDLDAALRKAAEG